MRKKTKLISLKQLSTRTLMITPERTAISVLSTRRVITPQIRKVVLLLKACLQLLSFREGYITHQVKV